MSGSWAWPQKAQNSEQLSWKVGSATSPTTLNQVLKNVQKENKRARRRDRCIRGDKKSGDEGGQWRDWGVRGDKNEWEGKEL